MNKVMRFSLSQVIALCIIFFIFFRSDLTKLKKFSVLLSQLFKKFLK